MPELVANGPIIPVPLMNDLDNERLVFFCGAGVSMVEGSNLPGFAELVDYIYEHNKIQPDLLETEALDLKEEDHKNRRPNFDTVLGLLERPERLGQKILRKTVIRRLSEPPTDKLRTHEALISLSRTERGVRLITTNFDNRFVQANLDENLVDVSPKLSVPKPHTWSSLVHLHGRIELGGDGSNLVLTAADFGRAYLTERWAARFITELFREFTVVFLGYSVNDPVMRYIVDALASERLRSTQFTKAYAFAGHDGTSENEQRVRAEWLAKNVEPILYNCKNNHKLLIDTLIEWARIRTDPFQARTQIALDGICKLPEGPDDPLAERVVWALQNPVAAQALAASEPISNEIDFPKIERWLKIFANAGLFNRIDNSAGSNSNNQISKPVYLVQNGALSLHPPELDMVSLSLSNWMSQHIHVPQVLAWMLKNSGNLHPELRRALRWKLADSEVNIPPKLRHLWSIVLDSEPSDSWRYMWTAKHYKNAASESEKRRIEEEILRQIAPRLVVRPGPSFRSTLEQDIANNPQANSPIDVCGHIELVAGDNGIWDQVSEILSGEDVLSKYAEILTCQLDRALTLLECTGKNIFQLSILRPSIADHEQNDDHDGWMRIINLVRDSYFAVASVDSARAGILLGRWVLSYHPLFKRLALHALTENSKSDIRHAKKLLTSDRNSDLWNLELRREVMRFFRKAGKRIPRTLLKEIVLAIHVGPGANPKNPPPNYPELIRRDKALCLHKLSLSGAVLDKNSKSLANDGKPPDGQIFDNRDEFLLWRGKAEFTETSDIVPSNLLNSTLNELVQALKSETISYGEFQSYVLKQPARAAFALRRLANLQEWPETYWNGFLSAITVSDKQRARSVRIECYVAKVLTQATDEWIIKIGLTAAAFVKQHADNIGTERETEFSELWNKVWSVKDQFVAIFGLDDPLTQALNNNAGKLAEAALTRLRKYELRAGEGLPSPVRRYFDTITSAVDAQLGRIILATRLYWLFTIDRKWAKEHLIPLMDAQYSKEAVNLWIAYSWSPKMGPDLLLAFKDSFLKILISDEIPKDRKKNLIKIFIAICLEFPRDMTSEEIHKVVNSMSEYDLKIVIIYLKSRLKGEPYERAQVWKKTIQPWLEQYWPNIISRNTSGTSEYMLDMLVECGDEFPTAVIWSLPHLKPIEGRALHALNVGIDIEQYGTAIFELLQEIINANTLQPHYKSTLRNILNTIKKSEPEIGTKLKYRNLYEIATS